MNLDGMRIEERGYSMITDEQGREWLFKKLYDDGWRYIVADKYDNMYLTNEKPSMFDDVDEVRISSCKKYIGITGVMAALPKLSSNEVFDIAEELGIVDWMAIKVDTPVLVSSDGISYGTEDILLKLVTVMFMYGTMALHRGVLKIIRM